MEPIVKLTDFPTGRFSVVNSSSHHCESPVAKDPRPSKIKRILLMTDFSPRGRVAYAHAAKLAEEHDAKITLTHFGRDRPPEHSGVSQRDFRRTQVKKLNHERHSSELANVRTSSRLSVHRNVAVAVRKFEDAVDCDLVVVYASATTRFGRFSSIDYAGDLLIGATVPVLLVGPKVPPIQENAHVVLVPFDLGRNSGAPFHSIDWVSRHFEGTFHFSQVTRTASNENPRWFDFWSRWRQAKLHQRATLLAESIEVLGGEEANETQLKLHSRASTNLGSVADLAKNLTANLIVVGDDRSLRNRILNLVRESPCPVLAVPNPT